MVRWPAGAALALLLFAVGPAGAQAPSEEPELPETPELLGAPAAFGAEAEAEERVAVPEGTLLRELPDPRSPSLATIDAPSELPVVERSGPWLRVRYGALVGWVALGGPLPPETEEETAPAEAAPPTEPRRASAEEPRERREHVLTIPPLPPSGASEEGARERRARILGTLPAVPPLPSDGEPRKRALAAAEAWAGPAPASGRPSVGGWLLFTDVDDPPLIRFLDQVVASLPEVYRDRYGLDPGSPDGEAVVLFTNEEDYREFAEENAGLLGIGEGGHAGHGVAALYAGPRGRDEVASLLVHELTHLMNARALGPRTPPWLEEGLANDLGFSEIRRGGRLEPGTVGGTQRRQFRVTVGRKAEVQYSWDGAKGAVVGLRRSLEDGELPSLETLLHLPWRELVDPAGRSQLYAESTFFVRYLIARNPEVFRQYLRRFTAGGTDDPDLLVEALASDWAALDEDFRRWFQARVDELRLLPDGAPPAG